MKGYWKMERKLCRRCGNWFTTKGQNTMCQYCIATTLGEINPVQEHKPRKKKDEPQIMKDVRAAKEHGMSYGEWMASKERLKY